MHNFLFSISRKLFEIIFSDIIKCVKKNEITIPKKSYKLNIIEFQGNSIKKYYVFFGLITLRQFISDLKKKRLKFKGNNFVTPKRLISLSLFYLVNIEIA